MNVYARAMRALTVKLVLLVAMLLMPFGMAAAPASGPQHSTMASMPAGHCPDQAPSHDMKGGSADCAMACAASLPAADMAIGNPLLIMCDPIHPLAAQRLNGLHPETATPPPRRS